MHRFIKGDREGAEEIIRADTMALVSKAVYKLPGRQGFEVEAEGEVGRDLSEKVPDENVGALGGGDGEHDWRAALDGRLVAKVPRAVTHLRRVEIDRREFDVLEALRDG